MVYASKVLADCLGTVNSEVVNGFYSGVEALDGVDTWHQFISRKFEYDEEAGDAKLLNVMTPSVKAQFVEDAIKGEDPFTGPSGIFSKQRDIDPDSYYIARDNDGNPLVNKNGEVVFRYKATGKVVEWDKIPFKKVDLSEEKWYKKPLLWFYRKMDLDNTPIRKDQLRMVAAPIWYPYVKNRLLDYVKFGRKYNPNLMTDKGWKALEDGIYWFFVNIENGKGSPNRYKTIYELFDGSQGNHWYLMSKMVNFFDRIIEDRAYAKEYLGYGFSDNKEFRRFQESVATYAGKATGSEKGVVLDVIDAEYANEVYGQKGTLLYSFDQHGTPVYDPHQGIFNKSYFLKLSVDQQLEQLKDYFGGLGKDFKVNPVITKIKINLGYNMFGNILRAIKVIGSPAFFSALMTLGKSFEGFMPLLILNSGMFVTDGLAMRHIIKGNWKSFFEKRGLNDGLPVGVKGYSSEYATTLGDIARKGRKLLVEAYKQGAFNINDSLMENSYYVAKYEQFFLAIFPEVKSLNELDNALETMKKTQPQKFVELLEAAKSYAEYAVRMSTTNTPIASTLTKVHPVQDSIFGRGRIYQPAVDTYYSMYHFFAGWGYNKTKGAWTILKDGMNNIMEGRIGARYLDELLAGGDTAREAYAKMTRAYLENEDLLYLFNKVYTALLIGKYIDRLSETSEEKNSENIFKDLGDMLSYMDVFSGEYAALFANPTGRIYKTFFDTFIGELEHDLDPAHAALAGSLATVKEYFRSLFRKLYMPKMALSFASKVNAHWDEEEKHYFKWLIESIQDEANGYMFYLKDSVENGGFSYFIPKGANAHVRDILGMGDTEIQFLNEEQLLSKYANLFNGNHTFSNWILYSFPFFKQWNMNQLVDVNDFVNDLTKVRGTQAYIDMTNLKMPEDATDIDYLHMYNVVTGRLNWDLTNLNTNDLSVDFTFRDEDTGELKYNKKRQIQEDLLYTVMQGGLSEEDAQKFIKEMSSSNITKQKAHALETLAYLEANQPGSSYQAVAYLMNAERFDYVKEHDGFDKDISKEDQQKIYQDARIAAAKKYADYVGVVDKNISWQQVMMFYLKTHNTDLAQYISDVGESYNKTLKFITPGDDQESVDGETNKIVYQNKILRQNFQAQLFVDILGAKGNINARMLANGYSLIFDTASYTREDGSLDPDYATFTLNQLEGIYDHINGMPMDDDQKSLMKQGTLQFADNLLPWVLKDQKLMAREDVRNVTQDWISFLYGEAKELNDAARERAEDDYANKTWNKGRKGYKNFYNNGYSRYPNSYLNWHNYLTGRIKSLYSKYRVFDWTPRSGNPNYLSESDFEAAKRAQAQFMYHGENPNTSKKSKSGKSKDDTIGVSSRRGKAFQFYKMEDPNKAVEYRLPWRKRWVRKGSGQKPIAPTTWKHLTPTPKR